MQKLQVEYHFEQQEQFRVVVYDANDDKNLNNLNNQEFLGGLEFQLHEVVTCIDQTMRVALLNSK